MASRAPRMSCWKLPKNSPAVAHVCRVGQGHAAAPGCVGRTRDPRRESLGRSLQPTRALHRQRPSLELCSLPASTLTKCRLRRQPESIPSDEMPRVSTKPLWKLSLHLYKIVKISQDNMKNIHIHALTPTYIIVPMLIVLEMGFWCLINKALSYGSHERPTGSRLIKKIV